MSFLTSRLLAIFWHVFKGVKPNSALTASSILSGLVGVNSDAVPIASAPIGGPSTITTTTSTSQVKSKPIFGFQFIQTTEVEGKRDFNTSTRNLHSTKSPILFPIKRRID